MPTVADIFRLHGKEYLDAFGSKMLPSHRRALQDILDCRTPVMGGHVYRCDHCGFEHYSYHSCGNRSCPTCHGAATEAWLADRRDDLLPVEYFHVVFTLPKELRSILRRHQHKGYDVLMKAAASALMKLASNKKHLGGQIGLMAVLHTWGQTLNYHPHVHCLVPGGGLDGDKWNSAREGFLVPVKPLSRLFRGIFMEMAAKKLPDVRIPKSVWNQDWVVHCKPAGQGPETVLRYLARYIHRVAISNSRIISVADGQVHFRYRKSGSRRWRTMTLPAMEFIRRYLQHVLPKGLHKVRYYGLWAGANRERLHRVQSDLAAKAAIDPIAETPVDPVTRPAGRMPQGRPCPNCGNGTLIFIDHLPRHRRAPP
jgi:hypothetical protein